MMLKTDLVKRLTRIVKSNHASTFFLNGPPGSGKSFLLKTLGSNLTEEIVQCVSFGPYLITAETPGELGRLILKDCFEAGFLDHIPQKVGQWDLVETWRWIEKNLQVGVRQTLLVFVELERRNLESLTEVARLFSTARYLEGNWNSPNIRWMQFFTGCWDHPAMEIYFREIETSFPYTVGHNYAVWEGISLDEMAEMIPNPKRRSSRIPYGTILYEITGGHPGAILDILKFLPGSELSIPAILTATHRAAHQGQAAKALCDLWTELSTESKRAIRDLLLQKRIPIISLPPHLENLYIAGIVRRKTIGAQSYLELRSWYVEMILWQNQADLELVDNQSKNVEFANLVPRTSSICAEAFQLINEIENLARNFATVRLSLLSDPDIHYLVGKSRKHNNYKNGVIDDAYERAEAWQHRNRDRGLSVDINPLIAYLSTRDLADLIEELGIQASSSEWLQIAEAIRSLSDIRDAVMHNQLIDDDALDSLYELQAEIYNAMSHLEIE